MIERAGGCGGVILGALAVLSIAAVLYAVLTMGPRQCTAPEACAILFGEINTLYTTNSDDSAIVPLLDNETVVIHCQDLRVSYDSGTRVTVQCDGADSVYQDHAFRTLGL